MRRLLTFAFIFSMAQEAWGLKRASLQDYRDIQVQLKAANTAAKDLAKKGRELILADEDEELTEQIEAEIELLKITQQEAAERAIWLTMRAYDIIPFEGDSPIFEKRFSVFPSPEIGTKITWLPIFDTEGPKVKQRANGSLIKDPHVVGSETAGNTASDGISRIYPSAFSSPPELASIIIHEKRHFLQNTTDGESNIKTTAELEVIAYKEEQALMNFLGMSGDIRKRQEKRLLEILNGKDGKPGKLKLAEDERLAANTRGSLVLEASLESHSRDQIAALVDKAKAQVLFAQIDHDMRLNDQYRALASRSCRNPGSITQAEVNALPELYKREPFDASHLSEKTCEERIYLLLYTNESVDSIEAWSRYVPPAKAQIPVRAIPLNPSFPPNPAAVPSNPAGTGNDHDFSGAILPIRKYVVEACATSSMVPMSYDLIRPQAPYRFSDLDVHLTNSVASELQPTCERPLFELLVNSIRNGQTDEINAQWVQLAAVRFRSQGYRQPYSDSCRDNGNQRCP